MSQLLELAKREQMKLARNVYELALYYTPMQRLPDLADFMAMYTRVQEMGADKPEVSAKTLWPTASDTFESKLVTRIKWANENASSSKTLLETLPKAQQQGMSPQDLFEFAFSQTKTGQQMAQDNKAA